MLKDELISRNALWKKFDEAHLFDDGNPRHIAQQIVEEAPAVDATVFPCKPGDTVFFIMCKTSGNHEIKEGLALSVQYHLCYKPLVNIRCDPGTTESTIHFLGLKAFMTREEAEAALAKMGGASND